MRRPPAYAKPLVDARKRGLVPARSGFGHVAVALSWREKRSGGLLRLVAPPDVPLADLDFSCLAGLDVLLTYAGADAARVPDVLGALFAAGATSVYAVNMDIFNESAAAYDSGDWEAGGAAWDRARVWYGRDSWQQS